jgi:hypothetical protein
VIGRIGIKDTPAIVLIGFPLSRVLKLSFFEVSLAFAVHLVVSPLSFIIGSSSLELIPALPVLEISFLLAYVLTTDHFVVDFMNSVQFFIVLFFASHSPSDFAVVSTSDRHA